MFSHHPSSVHMRRERVRCLVSLPFFYKNTSPVRLDPILMTSFDLYYLLRGLSLNTVTLGVGLQHMNLGGCHNSVHSSYPSQSSTQTLSSSILCSWVQVYVTGWAIRCLQLGKNQDEAGKRLNPLYRRLASLGKEASILRGSPREGQSW